MDLSNVTTTLLAIQVVIPLCLIMSICCRKKRRPAGKSTTRDLSKMKSNETNPPSNVEDPNLPPHLRNISGAFSDYTAVKFKKKGFGGGYVSEKPQHEAMVDKSTPASEYSKVDQSRAVRFESKMTVSHIPRDQEGPQEMRKDRQQFNPERKKYIQERIKHLGGHVRQKGGKMTYYRPNTIPVEPTRPPEVPMATEPGENSDSTISEPPRAY